MYKYRTIIYISPFHQIRNQVESKLRHSQRLMARLIGMLRITFFNLSANHYRRVFSVDCATIGFSSIHQKQCIAGCREIILYL